MIRLKLILSDGIEGYFRACGPDFQSDFFSLNRSFTVHAVAADGKPVSFFTEEVSGNCQLVRFAAPLPFHELTIHYSGALDGSTGAYPYAREKTSDPCFVLRNETAYYPYPGHLYTPDYYERLLNPVEEDRFELEISLLDRRVFCTNLQQIDSGHFTGFDPTVAVGPYRVALLPFGRVYSLTLEQRQLDDIEQILFRTNQYMNRYLPAQIRELQIIQLPAGLGSFVQGSCLFWSTDGQFDPVQLVHEAIHTHWNPRCTPTVQRSRFFDEGITQYFTALVCDQLGLCSLDQFCRQCREEAHRLLLAHPEWRVGISRYPELQAGDLAYSVEPLALMALREAVGNEPMEQILRRMLLRFGENGNERIDFERFRELFPIGAQRVFADWFDRGSAACALLE